MLCREKLQLMRQLLIVLDEIQSFGDSGRAKTARSDEIRHLLDREQEAFRKYDVHAREHGC